MSATEFCRAGALLLVMLFLPSCVDENMEAQTKSGYLTTNHSVRSVVNNPAFKRFGELMLPWQDNTKYFDTPLDQVGSLMPYHSHVNADVVVGALNHLIDEVGSGKIIFYDFYTDRQKQEDPTKKYTELFFYLEKPRAPFAIVCPGGGFSYVGSLQEGFPLAQEISRTGLNAFVIRYRVGEQKATEDLAAAITYIFRNAGTLGVGTQGYSLWGGSAGARMVGNIALRGVSDYGGGDLPKPAAIVIAYTGQSSYSSNFPPAFITVSADDPIANAATVDRRVLNLRNAGVEVEYRRYKKCRSWFRLGVGTDAQGWVEYAIEFWRNYARKDTRRSSTDGLQATESKERK